MKHLSFAAALLACSSALWAAPEGRVYTPGPFEGIEISGAAEVKLQQGNTDEIFVEGDAETQKQVDLRVRGNILRVDTAGGWRFWNSKRLQLTVTARQLSRITISGAAVVHAAGPVKAGDLAVRISGSGLARFDQLHAEKLAFSASGAGDADVAGQVNELSINVSGRSEFRGENLMSRNARVSISGVGDVKLWATEELSVSVSGVGQLEYWGQPNVMRRGSSGMANVVGRGVKPLPGAALAP